MKDFECSVDFIKSPFLVQESEVLDGYGKRKETLRLDVIQGSIKKIYRNAAVIVFNTGHWWTHQKTYEGYEQHKVNFLSIFVLLIHVLNLQERLFPGRESSLREVRSERSLHESSSYVG